jgi:hypothetical protein
VCRRQPARKPFLFGNHVCLPATAQRVGGEHRQDARLRRHRCGVLSFLPARGRIDPHPPPAPPTQPVPREAIREANSDLTGWRGRYPVAVSTLCRALLPEAELSSRCLNGFARLFQQRGGLSQDLFQSLQVLSGGSNDRWITVKAIISRAMSTTTARSSFPVARRTVARVPSRLGSPFPRTGGGLPTIDARRHRLRQHSALCAGVAWGSRRASMLRAIRSAFPGLDKSAGKRARTLRRLFQVASGCRGSCRACPTPRSFPRLLGARAL